MAGLFEGIIDTLKEKRKEGKIQYGLRYNPDLKVGGGYYDDNKMFEVEKKKQAAIELAAAKSRANLKNNMIPINTAQLIMD